MKPKVSERDRDRYGRHDLGRYLLMARRLIEAGVRFVKVNSYHWDSHGDNFNASQSLIPQFDQPFAALIEDLNERGMLDNVLMIAISEFGRTPRINSHVGPRPLAGGLVGRNGRLRLETRAGPRQDEQAREPSWRAMKWTSAICSTRGSGHSEFPRRRCLTTTAANHCRSRMKTCAPIQEILA